MIGTVGTEGKEKRALEFGASRVINREEGDFVSAVMAFTKGKDVDKVVDSTGASVLDRSFAVIRRLGHVVSFGEAEGRPFSNLWERLVTKSLTFTRFHLGHMDLASEAWRKGVDEVVGGIMSGALKVPIEGIFRSKRLARCSTGSAHGKWPASSFSPSIRPSRTRGTFAANSDPTAPI